ncbi:MAG: hypothetical protein ACMG6E_00780, partial [Candidatus Roizmanbacteria bacterium]
MSTVPNETAMLRKTDIDELLNWFHFENESQKDSILEWLSKPFDRAETLNAYQEGGNRLKLIAIIEATKALDHPLEVIIIERAKQRSTIFKLDAKTQDKLKKVITDLDIELGRDALSDQQLEILANITRTAFSDLTDSVIIDNAIIQYLRDLGDRSYSATTYPERWSAWIDQAALAGFQHIVGNDKFVDIIATPLGVNLHFMEPITIINLVTEKREYLRDELRKTIRTKRQKESKVALEKLTEAEIADILDVVRYPGSFEGITDIAEGNVRPGLEKQLRNVMIEKSLVSSLKFDIAKKFEQALVPTGHPVGLIAAQSIGEEGTQAGLKAAQHAGITAETGFTRLLVVTDVREGNSPLTFIGLKGNPNIQEARVFASNIEATTIDELVTSEVGRTNEDVPDILTDATGKKRPTTSVFLEEPWMKAFMDIFVDLTDDEDRMRFTRPAWIIRLTFNIDRMYQKRIDTSEVAYAIEKSFPEI